MSSLDEVQDRMEIAKRLQKIRCAKGFSQEEMAKKMNLAHITYVKLENAAHNITTKNLKKISRILNVTTELILFGDTGIDYINFNEYIRCAQLFNSDGLESFKNSIDMIQKLHKLNNSFEV